MARGSIYFLGQNPEFTVLVDQIFARASLNGGTLIIPVKIEFSSFPVHSNERVTKAEILLVKGYLGTENGSRCSESTVITNHTISKTRLSFLMQFEFLVSYDIINRIEKLRKKDLPLLISVAATAAVFEEIILPGNQKNYLVSNFDNGSGHVNFQIPQSDWVNKILPQTGHDSFRLIELPSKSQVIPDQYANSIRELDEAQKYFLNGDYDKTVAHCRSALDPFKAKKDEIKTHITSKSEFIWVNEVLEATDEWLNKLVKSTTRFTSKAHHIPSMGHFDRTEAEIIMMVTVALIAYIGKL